MHHMIQETITYTCHSCGSTNIIKNDTNKCGNQQYHCKDCRVYRVLKPTVQPHVQQKEQVVQAYQERVSLRGLQRIFGVHRQTAWQWIQVHNTGLPSLAETLLPAQADDILELDEVWSFVGKRAEKWIVCSWVGSCGIITSGKVCRNFC